MHLFFDTVWKLHIGEIPEKPDFEKLKNNPVFKDYKFYTGYKNEDIQQQHDDEIAAIKQNALTVGNPELIPVFPKPHVNGFIIPKNFKPGEFYFWPGGYENRYEDIKIITTRDGASFYDTTTAILTLPEEKTLNNYPMKFRKKPVVIEAFRMGIDPRPDWFTQAVTDDRITTYTDDPNQDPFTFVKTYCLISTLEGKMKGDYGDFIIQGVNGEIYPCKPDIFEKTYEPV